MSLVKNYNVPGARSHEHPETCIHVSPIIQSVAWFCEIKRNDDPFVKSPFPRIGHTEVDSINKKSSIKFDEHFLLPLSCQAGGNDNQDAADILTPFKCRQEKSDLDRLS